MTTFTVPDMSCTHCVGTIRTALEKALPQAEIAIDLGAHEVKVAGDKAVAEQAIRDAGYTPQPRD